MDSADNFSVSVIMPVYEAAQFIESAVQSVFAQSHQPIEIIMLVDPSFDATEEIAVRLAKKDARIVLICNEKILGPAGSRNVGIALAKGRYIAFLDADDIWLPLKLERQVEVMRRTGCALCCTSYVFMSATEQPMTRLYHVSGSISFDEMLRENKIGPSACMLRSDVAKAYQMDNSYFHEDYVYWLSILRDGHTAYGIDEPLMKYRIAGRSRNKILMAWHRWVVYRRFLNMNLLESFYYWTCYIIRALRKYSNGVWSDASFWMKIL